MSGARNHVFLSKMLRGLWLDVRPVFTAFAAISVAVTVSIGTFVFLYRGLSVCSHVLPECLIASMGIGLSVCQRSSDKNGSGFHLCELFHLKHG